MTISNVFVVVIKIITFVKHLYNFTIRSIFSSSNFTSSESCPPCFFNKFIFNIISNARRRFGCIIINNMTPFINSILFRTRYGQEDITRTFFPNNISMPITNILVLIFNSIALIVISYNVTSWPIQSCSYFVSVHFHNPCFCNKLF